MASRDKQVKLVLKTEVHEELCEVAASLNVTPGELSREILESLLDQIREVESDPVAKRALMEKLGIKGLTVH